MVVEYIMIAAKISDGYTVTWAAVGTPDTTATFAPISSSLLVLPATVDYMISSPTAGAGGIVFTVAGGDLSGNYPNPTVAKIMNTPIKPVAPTDQQVLTYVSADGYLEFKDQSSGSGAGSGAVTPVSSPNYTTGSDDFLISVDTSSVPLTVLLSSVPTTGKIIQVKDANGHAGTHNITVSGNGKTIDGLSAIIINQNYGNLSVIYNGSTWSLM